MPMLFKSCCMMSIQFFCGLWSFLFKPLAYSLSWQFFCRPFAERARAISVFSLLRWNLGLYFPVVSAPWPSRYWLCLSMRYPSIFFGTCGVHCAVRLWVRASASFHIFTLTVLLHCAEGWGYLRGIFSLRVSFRGNVPGVFICCNLLLWMHDEAMLFWRVKSDAPKGCEKCCKQCRLVSGAKCADGLCCNVQRCQVDWH